MGKKVPNIVKFKKGIYKYNIPSVKKANKVNNNNNKKKKKNKRKRHKNNKNTQNFTSQIKDNISNNNFFINNLNINNNDGNPFIFNAIYTNKKPEWMSLETQKIQDINDRFNEEIYEYVNYIIPKDFSLSQRQNTKQRLINIIKKYQPKWQVVLFGSFSQNTSTVFSDLDFAILSKEDSSRKMDINELIYLMKILKHEGFSRNIRLIRARVPILKATCSLTGINVDISVNRQNGYEAAGLIRKILKKHKILKPSIIILKILLKKNNLNDAHTGGMSSFLLFHLVYFYYITYIKRNERNRFNNNININEDEKEDISYNDHNSNIDDNEEQQEDEYIDENEDNYDEEKEISYDSNSDLKWNGKNKLLTKDGIITKPISTDEEDNSNDDSNYIKNGTSSSNSGEDNASSTKYNNNNLSDFIQDFDENEEEEEEHEDYKNDKKDYNNNNEEEKNNEEKNNNIGHFIFTFLKFYGKEFQYKEFGFSLNQNTFGNTFFKLERNDMVCSDYICAESIQEQSVDVGRSCYNYPKIVNLFKTSYNKIKIEKQKNTCSILKTLGFPTI